MLGAWRSVRRHLRLWRIFLVQSLIQDLEYRLNWWLNAFNTLLFLASSALVLWVVFSQSSSIGGWSFDQALTLLGFYLLIEGVTLVFLVPNLNRVPEAVRKGDMDFLLLKPVAARFIVSTRYASVWWLPQIGFALAVIGVGMARQGTLSAANLLLAGLMLGAAIAILYAVWFALTTTAFWFVKVDNVSELFTAFFAAGRFPISAYPGWVRAVLTFVVPVAFLTTVPAEAASGLLRWPWAFASLAMATLLLGLSQWLWRTALAAYTSASS
jgi:ABC-2 type transport system permease protein